MRLFLSCIAIFVLLLPAGCAQKELCPGETRVQQYTRIQTHPRGARKKAQPSMIFVTKSNTSKRKPPK